MTALVANDLLKAAQNSSKLFDDEGYLAALSRKLIKLTQTESRWPKNSSNKLKTAQMANS